MDQKSEERLIMDYFRESFSDFPKGKLIQSESPDYILKPGPKKSIGIELTRLDQNAASLKEKIEATLKNKSDKIGLYQQKKMKAIWLVVHADFIESKKSYNILNKIEKWTFETEFDKVFLFDLFERKIYELNLYSGT